MLKMLKVKIEVELKGDPTDLDDLKYRLFDYLEGCIEEDDLDFSLDDENSEEVDEE